MSANTRFETLADIVRHRANIGARCRCGHHGVVEGTRLARYYWVRRWDSRVFAIGDHLRCSRCGARAEQVRITNARPNGPAWGPQSEADWKRLAARLRG